MDISKVILKITCIHVFVTIRMLTTEFITKCYCNKCTDLKDLDKVKVQLNLQNYHFEFNKILGLVYTIQKVQEQKYIYLVRKCIFSQHQFKCLQSIAKYMSTYKTEKSKGAVMFESYFINFHYVHND